MFWKFSGSLVDLISKIRDYLDSRPLPKPPFMGTKVENNYSSNINVNLRRLALVSALGIVHSLPTLHSTTDEYFRRYMKRNSSYAGFISPSRVKDPVVLKTLKEYAKERLSHTHDLLDGAFHVIIDTGCSTSASPYKEDFESLGPLRKPVTLTGIAGESTVTKVGLLKCQCINTKGEIVTVRTVNLYDPNLHVRLFSPQSCFFGRKNQSGKFTISWSQVFLELYNGKSYPDVLPCFIDKDSFMPLLTCFHDADKAAASILHNGIVENDSKNLTATQWLLLRFHFKLGHLGFTHLKWLLSSGLFGPQGIHCSNMDAPNSKCQACLQGGQ